MSERTILQLMAILDRTEEFADCILWKDTVSATGHPIYRPTGCPCTLVRRAVFDMAVGDLVPRQPIDTSCNEKRCLNPAHLERSTTAKIAQKAAKRGAWSSKARGAKIAASKRTKAKLTIGQATEIRMSTESGPVLAERYGVNKSLINGIKSGNRWKDYTSPFSGLMR